MADRFWILGTGSWSDTAHWSTSSGGSGGANVPTSSDDVFIDANSGFGGGGTITITSGSVCKNFTATSGHSYILDGTTYELLIYGSLTLEGGLSTIGTFWFDFYSEASETITVNGATIDGRFEFYGTGTWTMQDDVILGNQFKHFNGTFDANGHNITANSFNIQATAENTPIVMMGTGIWEATGYGISGLGAWRVTDNAGTVSLNAESSTIKISDSSSYAKYFNGGNKVYNNIWFTGNGTGDFQIVNSNTFNDFKVDTPPHNVWFQGGTQIVNSFSVSGEDGKLIYLNNSAVGQFILSKSSGIVSCDYLDIANSNAIGGATWYAGNHSLDTTNNDGWIFEKRENINEALTISEAVGKLLSKWLGKDYPK